MEFEVHTHPDAKAELDEAAERMSWDSNWAPTRLLNEYDQFIARIQKFPESFRFIYDQYRRLNLAVHNYTIIYRLRENDIYVIAFMHQKRHPDYWKHRIEDDINQPS